MYESHTGVGVQQRKPELQDDVGKKLNDSSQAGGKVADQTQRAKKLQKGVGVQQRKRQDDMGKKLNNSSQGGGRKVVNQTQRAKKLVLNACAARRYRQRAVEKSLGVLASASCALQKRGALLTGNPGKRTLHQRKSEVRKLQGVANPRDEYPDVVVLACNGCANESHAATAGFELPATTIQLSSRGIVTMPRLLIKKSGIELAGAGVFCREDCAKGRYMCEYFGTPINRKAAVLLAQNGDDTHLKTMVSGQAGWFLDGRRMPDRTMSVFIEGNRVGSFVNDARKNKTFRLNCEYVIMDQSQNLGAVENTCGFLRTSRSTMADAEGLWKGERCFLKSTKPIFDGDELFVSYGKGWHKRHEAV